MAELTPKQRRFAEEYIVDLNGTQAAIRAGYAANGASVTGTRLLADPKINRLIETLRAERSQKTGVDAAWLLTRLADEASADVADLFDADGKLLPVKDWPKIWRQGLVAGVEIEQLFDGRGSDREQIGNLVKVKLSDRVKRLELIGRHIGVQAFKDVVEHKGLDGLAERLDRAARRGGEGD